MRRCFRAWRWKQTDGSPRSAAVTTSPPQSVSSAPHHGGASLDEEARAVQEASVQAAGTDKQAHRCLFLSMLVMTVRVTPRQEEEMSCCFLGNQRYKRINAYRSVEPHADASAYTGLGASAFSVPNTFQRP